MAVAADVVDADWSIPQEERAKIRDQYLQRSVDLLEMAMKLNHFRNQSQVAWLQQHADFEALQDDARFKDFMCWIDAEQHYQNAALLRRGSDRVDQAMVEYQEAIDIATRQWGSTDARTLNYLNNFAVALKDSQQFDAAAKQLDAIIATRAHIFEDKPEDKLNASMLGRAYCNLGLCFHALGQYDNAIEANIKAAQHENVADISNYNLGCAYALKNETDKAFEALYRSVDLGFGSAEQYEKDPDLERLHNDSRFDEIMRKIKAREIE